MRPLTLALLLATTGCPSSDESDPPIERPLRPTDAQGQDCADALASEVQLPPDHFASLVDFSGDGIWISSFVQTDPEEYEVADGYVSLYGCDGALRAGPTRVPSPESGLWWLAIHAHGDRLLTAWQVPQEGSVGRVSFQLYDSEGQAITDAIDLADHGDYRFSTMPQIAGDEDGFLVAMASVDAGLDPVVRVVRIGWDGAVGETVVSHVQDTLPSWLDFTHDGSAWHLMWGVYEDRLWYQTEGAAPYQLDLTWPYSSLGVTGGRAWIGTWSLEDGFWGAAVYDVGEGTYLELREIADEVVFSLGANGGAVGTRDSLFGGASDVIRVDDGMNELDRRPLPEGWTIRSMRRLTDDAHLVLVSDDQYAGRLQLFDFGG